MPNETHLKRLISDAVSRHITHMEGEPQEIGFISVVRIPGSLRARFSMH
jgi:hypothetical protein